MTEPLRAIDLFCGAGGMSLGFHKAGYRIAVAVDMDEKAAETFSRNLAVLQRDDSPVVLAGEQGNLDHLDLENLARQHPVDVLIGGPPCQAFSRIGRAKLQSLTGRPFDEDERLVLYERFLEAVSRWQPRAFVMENVPGMLIVNGHNVAKIAVADMTDLGYNTGYALLNAAWYGVPQFRERLFFIGFRRDLGVAPSAPTPTHQVLSPSGYIFRPDPQNLTLDFLENPELPLVETTASTPPVSVGDAIGDLPKLTEHLGDEAEPRRRNFRRERDYRVPPHSAYATLMRSWPGFEPCTSIDDHEIRLTPRDHETFRRMQPGDRYPQALVIARQRFQEDLDGRDVPPLPESPEYVALKKTFVPPYPEDDFIDKWRKLDADQPSWTVTAHLSKDSYSHIHYDPEQARGISVREAARLQSFPDGFKFTGNKGDCFRQIGNAVPPLLAAALASHIAPALIDHTLSLEDSTKLREQT